MTRRIKGIQLYKKLPKNTEGRDLYVTDIHGHFSLLRELLKRANFDESKDRLLIGGDLVDRGPESAEVALWLTYSWVYSVRGNHDQMAIDYSEQGGNYNYIQNGGMWFIKLMEEDDDLAFDIADKFRHLPIAMEVEGKGGERFGFVHAECPLRDWDAFVDFLENEKDQDEILYTTTDAMWKRTRIEELDTRTVKNIDKIFVGHTSVSKPASLGNTFYMDTCAFSENGCMTLVDINSERVWTLSMKQLMKLKNRSDSCLEKI